MPLVIPRFLQARDLYSFTVQAGTLGASGITWASATELAIASTGSGTFKAVEVGGNPSLEQFRASDLGAANYQNEYEDWTLTIREIIPTNGAGALGVLAATTDYVRVVAAYRPRYSAGARNVLIAVGTRGTFNTTIQQGENLNVMTIQPIGYGIFIGLSTDVAPI